MGFTIIIMACSAVNPTLVDGKESPCKNGTEQCVYVSSSLTVSLFGVWQWWHSFSACLIEGSLYGNKTAVGMGYHLVSFASMLYLDMNVCWDSHSSQLLSNKQ